jgi:hypothetical protein
MYIVGLLIYGEKVYVKVKGKAISLRHISAKGERRYNSYSVFTLTLYCNVLGVLYSRWNFIALQK